MSSLSRQILIELLWLLACAWLTVALALFLFRPTDPTETIDIYLHDTWYVIAPLTALSPFIFLLVTFLIYFVKEFRNSFKRKLPNLILITAGSILIIAITLLIVTVSQFDGWYPPLSALPAVNKTPITKFVTNFGLVIQIAILLMLLFATYRWGTQKKSKLK